jgi:hypothetical protein
VFGIPGFNGGADGLAAGVYQFTYDYHLGASIGKIGSAERFRVSLS